MPYKIAIASGKGGTGKTTVSVNLYHYLNKAFKNKVQLIDCDVEEPNDLLFFEDAVREHVSPIQQQIPQIDPMQCTFCKKCVEFCMFNAISVIAAVKHAEITASLCHSCGACSTVCPSGAISETACEIGTISKYRLNNGIGLTEGRLKIGSSMQTSVIRSTKRMQNSEAALILFDAPPGTSCPVVATIADADFVILVTEPTPFGLHDLLLMVELLREIKIPFGIIINKTGLGNNETYQFAQNERLKLLGEIPFSKSYAANYAVGKIMQNIPAEIEKSYLKIVDEIIIHINDDLVSCQHLSVIST